MTDTQQQTILVTGATGYVGGRLVPYLLAEGYRVRVMTRNPRHLGGRSWENQVEVVQADVLKPETLSAALDGVFAAYYLIHSMDGGTGFEDRDSQAARNFAQAAKSAGVGELIYLGGLGEEQHDALSKHLESRHKVGHLLREHGKNVTEFRAAMVVGAGSLSFETLRYLAERVPIMICPSWVYTRTQPIAIDDVIRYMVAALKTEESNGKIIEIGTDDIVTYRDMMGRYAAMRGLTRIMLPVPLLTPRLSSYWVHFITPVSATIIRPLIEGLRNEMIADTTLAKTVFPHIQPMSFDVALDTALSELTAQQVESSWADSMAATWAQDEPYTFTEERGMMIEQRRRDVNATPEIVYQAFTSLGGDTGWLYLNWLWHLRGSIDRAFGGPGYRRGRRDDAELRVGDTLDFWRVEALEENYMLRLRAEMKLPGKGWLQFVVIPHKNGKARLVQTAYYAPKGLWGYLYWYSIFFLHKFIFDGLIDRVVARAEAGNPQPEPRKLPIPLLPLALMVIVPVVIIGFIITLLDNSE